MVDITIVFMGIISGFINQQTSLGGPIQYTQTDPQICSKGVRYPVRPPWPQALGRLLALAFVYRCPCALGYCWDIVPNWWFISHFYINITLNLNIKLLMRFSWNILIWIQTIMEIWWTFMEYSHDWCESPSNIRRNMVISHLRYHVPSSLALDDLVYPVYPHDLRNLHLASGKN